MILFHTGDVVSNADFGILAHVTNNKGIWGGGVSGPIGVRYPQARIAFSQVSQTPMICGRAQIIPVSSTLFVANLFAMTGVRSESNPRPLNYVFLRRSLDELASFARAMAGSFALADDDVDIHLPRIGAGLAGGDWPTIEEMIRATLSSFKTTIYTLPNELHLFPENHE